ncbi:MAG: ABC transporter permease, partial [Proteobacteria bacterium]|nr:ABC transporter permease [Pseudomonadota bacterium]
MSGNLVRELKGIFIAIGISFFVGIIIIIVTSKMPLKALSSFFLAPFSSRYNLCILLTTMTPLTITGLAMSISFQTKVWNLAGEGQVYLGAFMGIVIGLQIPNWPPVIAVIAILVVGFLVGGVLGLLPAALRLQWGVNELITSYMASLIILPVVNYFLAGPMKMPGAGINTTDYVNKAFILPKILPACDLHLGFGLALILVLVT